MLFSCWFSNTDFCTLLFDLIFKPSPGEVLGFTIAAHSLFDCIINLSKYRKRKVVAEKNVNRRTVWGKQKVWVNENFPYFTMLPLQFRRPQ